MTFSRESLRRHLRQLAWPFTERREWNADHEHFHVADGDHVRMSLPWSGVASWADMHAYVTKVITDNYVPSPERAGYGGLSDLELAQRSARAVLLSLCHRLKIEPVGAFDPYREENDE